MHEAIMVVTRRAHFILIYVYIYIYIYIWMCYIIKICTMHTCSQGYVIHGVLRITKDSGNYLNG